MCGIAGIVADNGPAYLQAVKTMTDCMNHRGPDGDGQYAYDHCVLGHRRLSIVDLEGGHQPMFNANRSIGIVFNGEIYGYKSLRDKTPYPYQNNSDTELLIALYEKEGAAFVEKLPGMFSFSIWDDKNKQLVCARDRFGEKPFYYAYGKNGEFIYASEIKSILATGLVQPVLNRDSLAHYLKHLYVHPHTTIYKNVFVLPPAHRLTYSFNTKKTDIKRYWHMPAVNPNISLDNAVEQFRELFDTAVKNQLVADVPVGAFLSGGLDSSTVVAVASKYKQGIKTISFGFGENINELPFAREIATRYNTHHIELQQKEADIAGLLLKMQDIYDEPFGDSSNIPTYLISKLAKQYLTVILTGDGGDELLGGYGSYKILLEMMKGKTTAKAAIPLVKLALKVASKTGVKVNRIKHEAAMRNTLHEGLFAAHNEHNVYFNDSEISALGFGGKAVKPPFSFPTENTIDAAIKADVEDYMPGDILVKTDRASMASSVELRAPFLDVPFAEFCLSLPHALKVSSSSDKIILREAYQQLWSDSIRKRSKQGFGAPVNVWLKLPGVKELKQQYLQNRKGKMYEILDYTACEKYFSRDNYHTWLLLVLAIWMEKHTFQA